MGRKKLRSIAHLKISGSDFGDLEKSCAPLRTLKLKLRSIAHFKSCAPLRTLKLKSCAPLRTLKFHFPRYSEAGWMPRTHLAWQRHEVDATSPK